MAIYPDFIVLKNSTDPEATIKASIQQGGDDEIAPGELVVGRFPAGAKLYTVDSDGQIVQVGQGSRTIVSTVEPASTVTAQYWRLTNVTGSTPQDTSIKFDDIHFFLDNSQQIEGAGIGTITLLHSLNTGITPTSFHTPTDPLSRLTDEIESEVAFPISETSDGNFYLQWDLGSQTEVGYISIASRDQGNRLRTFEIEHSTDGVSFISLGLTSYEDSDFSNLGTSYGPYRPTDNLRALNDGAALVDGDLWFAPNNSNLHVYYNSNWVLVSGAGGGGDGSVRGDGGDFDDGSVDVSFAMSVYGGGDFDSATVDTPVELLNTDDGPDGGTF